MYSNAMEQLKAKELLDGMGVSDYPHISEDSRRKMHKDLHKIANPEAWSAKKALTLAEVAGVLSGR